MKRSVMLMLFFMVAALIASQAAMHVIDMRHGLSESRIRKICISPGVLSRQTSDEMRQWRQNMASKQRKVICG